MSDIVRFDHNYIYYIGIVAFVKSFSTKNIHKLVETSYYRAAKYLKRRRRRRLLPQ